MWSEIVSIRYNEDGTIRNSDEGEEVVMERLTKRTAEGIAYLANVKQDEQVIEGSRNTLKCLYDSWQKLAEYEDREKGCEYCDERNMPLWWNNAGHPTKSFIEPNFCPMCGKDLKEVANENS